MWDAVSREDGEAREKEYPRNIFKLALSQGARMVRHNNTTQSAHDIIREITMNRPTAVPIQRSLTDERKNIVRTTSGGAINRESNEKIGRHQDGLKRVEGDTMQALRKRDDETKQGLEEKRRALREWMDNIKDPEELEARMKGIDQGVKEEELADLSRRLQDATNASAADRARLEKEMKERERVEAEHKQQLADLTRRLQHEANLAAAHRAKSEQDLKKLQDQVATAVTTPPRLSPCPTLYAQVLFRSVTHDG